MDVDEKDSHPPHPPPPGSRDRQADTDALVSQSIRAGGEKLLIKAVVGLKKGHSLSDLR